METRKIITYIIGIGWLLTACVKDDLFKTPHPTQGAMNITTDWTMHSPEAVLPDSYYLRIDHAEQEVTENTNVFALLLNPGKHTLLAYNTPQHMTVDASTASVNLQEDGTLEPLPGYLFTADAPIEVRADDTLRITLPMQQRTHLLTLSLKLTPGDDLLIASTAATLTGIASQVDLLTGILTGGSGANVAPDFSITSGSGMTRADPEPILSATLRLLGVRTDETQLFTLVVTMTNGQTQTIVTDLTELLKNLSTAVGPIQIDARLNLLVEAGVNSTITDWIVASGGESEAN